MESDLEQRRTRNSIVRDAREFSLLWRMWMWLLMAVNLVAPLFFLSRLEAWATLGSYVIAAAVIVPLHRRLGWVRLLGVGHFVWLLLLPWLYFRALAGSPTGALYIWIWTVIWVDTVCLGIDLVDVFRYISGERAPIVPRKQT
ncbi:MAG: hypothetical protein WAK57_06135, partial [Desulfobacterales bacterium]